MEEARGVEQQRDGGAAEAESCWARIVASDLPVQVREVLALQASARCRPPGLHAATGVLPRSLALQVWQQALYALGANRLNKNRVHRKTTIRD